jgi:NADH-quinone oxidoreductase subunit N
MNVSVTILEIAVILLGIGILLADLWTPAERKVGLGYVSVAGLGVILLGSFFLSAGETHYAFGHLYILDAPALYFKRFFLIAAILVSLMAVEFSDRIQSGISEFYALLLFALAGMMFAASANDLIMLFVSVELITVTFYVLTSFQRARVGSLEAGVKYLILGALSTAFTVYGIALVFGSANSTGFEQIRAADASLAGNSVFLLGLLLVLVGLGFKIAAVPFQIWAPDVYQGAPTPVTAFLAVGSKAAGFALLLRFLLSGVPQVSFDWTKVLMVISGASILYGNLCAIPQRNLKRLMGYSSIAHAGYLLLGVAAMNLAGCTAVLYYLGGYLFTVLGAFTVLCIVLREVEGEDISTLAGLHQRSPLLAVSLGLTMISLAGIPPMAGFFGKFLLLKALLERGALQPAFLWLAGIAVVGVVISFYYYLGVVRAVFWSDSTHPTTVLNLSPATRWALYACIAGMLYLGVYPNPMVRLSTRAATPRTTTPATPVLGLTQPGAGGNPEIRNPRPE